MACVAPLTGGGILSGTLNYLDCQAQVIGSSGYQVLASPSSSVSIALTGVLTIFIGWYGIRMTMGILPSFGDAATAAFKIGFVLLLASSWSAYQVTAYNLILFAPAELVGDIGGAAGLPGSTGGLISRLQGVDDALVALTNFGTGRGDLDAVSNAIDSGVLVSQSFNDDFAFGWARAIYIASTLSALGLLRIVAGLLLALAPVFAGFLLFQATHSFFWGWARALAATALSAVSATIILGVALAVFEPLLADALAQRSIDVATLAAPFELFALAAAFAIMVFGAIFLSVKLCFAVAPQAIPRQMQPADLVRSDGPYSASPPIIAASKSLSSLREQEGADQTRTYAIARSLHLQDRMSSIRSESEVSRLTENLTTRAAEERRRGETEAGVVRLGQTYRRDLSRVSGASAKRNART